MTNKAMGVRLLAMDVDGVLTAGEVIVLQSGEEVKFWNAKDRLGLALLRDRHPQLEIAWITGRSSNAVALAAKDLGVKFLFQRCADKKSALMKIVQVAKLAAPQVAFIGDDLIDLPPLLWAGFSACPADAVGEVRNVVDYISPRRGGEGVVRDVLELILKAQGKWKDIVQPYYA